MTCRPGGAPARYICAAFSRAAVGLPFVDDSGSPTTRRAAGDSGLYILAGVAVNDRDIPSVARAVGDAKAEISARIGIGEWEAHACDVWNNTGQFGTKEGRLSMRQKREIFSGMAGVISHSRPDVIPVVVDKIDHERQKSRRKPQVVGWSVMFRRFERMLGLPGEECGLILADAGRRADEKAARAIVERTGRACTEDTHSCAGVLNGAICRDSRLDIMIQPADMVAYAVHRHHRKSAHFQGWFEAIKPKFDSDAAMMYA